MVDLMKNLEDGMSLEQSLGYVQNLIMILPLLKLRVLLSITLMRKDFRLAVWWIISSCYRFHLFCVTQGIVSIISIIFAWNAVQLYGPLYWISHHLSILFALSMLFILSMLFGVSVNVVLVFGQMNSKAAVTGFIYCVKVVGSDWIQT